MLVAVDFDFRLIDGDLLAIPSVGLKEVFQSMKPRW